MTFTDRVEYILRRMGWLNGRSHALTTDLVDFVDAPVSPMTGDKSKPPSTSPATPTAADSSGPVDPISHVPHVEH
jgi:hypothetical protein